MHGWPRCGDQVILGFQADDPDQLRVLAVVPPAAQDSPVDARDAYTFVAGPPDKKPAEQTSLQFTPTGPLAGILCRSAELGRVCSV